MDYLKEQDAFHAARKSLKQLANDPVRYQIRDGRSRYISSDNTEKVLGALVIRDEELTEADFD